MDKNTKMLLGVGAVAVIGYLVWKNNQPKANLTGTAYECVGLPHYGQVGGIGGVYDVVGSVHNGVRCQSNGVGCCRYQGGLFSPNESPIRYGS
jgi:hypothetical protein